MYHIILQLDYGVNKRGWVDDAVIYVGLFIRRVALLA